MARCESQSKRTTKRVVKGRSVFLALRLFAARKSRKKIYFVFGSLKWQELWNNETDFAAVCDATTFCGAKPGDEALMNTRIGLKRKRSLKGQRLSGSRRSGQALIEMAASIFLLLAILMGVMEFGFFARNNLILANASREGARAASVGRSTSATQQRITNSVKSLTTTFGTTPNSTEPKFPITNGTSWLTYSTDNGANWYIWPADSGGKNGVPVGSLIKVIVAARHKPLTNFFWFMRNRDIAQFTTIKREPNG